MADPGTLAEAQEEYAKWLTASSSVSTGQSYSIGGRALSRADSADIREWLKYWGDKINELTPVNLNPSDQQGVVISQFDLLNER